MLRRLLLASAGAACLLAAPAPAQAGWKIDRSRAIAEVAWRSPCDGRATWSWERLPPRVNAESDRSRCQIWITTRYRYAWPWFCTLILHEYGHLAGARHVNDRRSVMYRSLVFPDRRCARRGRPYLARHGRH